MRQQRSERLLQAVILFLDQSLLKLSFSYQGNNAKVLQKLQVGFGLVGDAHVSIAKEIWTSSLRKGFITIYYRMVFISVGARNKKYKLSFSNPK
jgi:hypothetical protein